LSPSHIQRGTFTQDITYLNYDPYNDTMIGTDPKQSTRTFKDDVTFGNLKEENKKLRRELHKLRKMEAGWFGKNKNYIKKEVYVRNNHYHEEI
jgi:hypothetical protein